MTEIPNKTPKHREILSNILQSIYYWMAPSRAQASPGRFVI
jgi:hypothetical protein